MESLPGYPVSPGHALIIPKRHVASYFDLTNHEREAMNVMLQYVRQKVEERYIIPMDLTLVSILARLPDRVSSTAICTLFLDTRVMCQIRKAG